MATETINSTSNSAKPDSKAKAFILFCIFVVPGLFLSIGTFAVHLERQCRWTRTTGTVVGKFKETVYHRHHSTSTLYHPVVTFRGRSGSNVTFVSGFRDSFPDESRKGLYFVGKNVDVLYNPRNPNQAEIASEMYIHMVFSGVVALFLVCCVYVNGGDSATLDQNEGEYREFSESNKKINGWKPNTPIHIV